jgi:GT2 family glycosyltransferase/glycosyltransferase involved in cell wall biosynthesis
VSRPGAHPKTQAEWFGEQAHDAWQLGQVAFAEGRLDDARRWLERARRFAPADSTVALSLAVVLLRQSDADAAPLFGEVTQAQDIREAWIGLAATHAQSGDWSAAATALGSALGRHAIHDITEVAPLAERIVAACAAPGWACVGGDGRIHVRLAGGAQLPRAPTHAPLTDDVLHVRVAGRELLGSPIDLTRLRRLDGFVEEAAGGLAGWAWHPANPEADPQLIVDAGRGRRFTLIATEIANAPDRPLSRPRRFCIPFASLAGWTGPVHVTSADGRDLPGSPLTLETGTALARSLAFALPAMPAPRRRRPPLDPQSLSMPADHIGPAARAPRRPSRRLAVVIPVYRNLTLTQQCLALVCQTMPAGTNVIVVDDASPEADLAGALDAMAGARRIRLLRHRSNRGFPAAANTGMRAATALSGQPDIVLLNADALLTAGALTTLRDLVQASSDIGTATPLSNDATILSYPHLRGNPLPPPKQRQRLGRLAATANAGRAVDIPTGVGFCLYIRRECLLDVGLFRETSFAQGYGEENDFCLRARHLGWRHVAAPGVFVGHAGGASFGEGALGSARTALITRNLRTLERLHPGYHALIAAYQAADPLADARRRLDAARWAATRRRRPARILITHDSGGGVERVIRARCAALVAEGKRAVVLRPVRDPTATSADERTYLPGVCEVCDGTARDTPNLRFTLPSGLDDLVRLLRPDRPDAVEIHHLQGHDPVVTDLAGRLGITCQIHIHDFAWFCPRVTLLGPTRHYCGEPAEVATCEACIADAGRNDERSDSVSDLRAHSAVVLAGAAVFAPSGDAAIRITRHFPQTRPHIAALENDEVLPPDLPLLPRSGGRRRVGIVGAIGVEKGYDVLLACAREAAASDLPLEFVIIGHSIDDARLFATGRVFITGPYREERVLEEIRTQSPDLAFLPSIWPETWCFTLGEAWRAGLHVAAFDIGAPAERIRRTGRGWLLPLGLPPAAINTALLSISTHKKT